MTDAILESTDNGNDPKKLTKPTYEVIQALLDSRADEGDEGDEGAGEEGEGGAGDEDLTSREHLNIAADLNEVMGLESGIDTTTDDKVFG